MNIDDDIREPIPTRVSKIIDDEEEFIEYKKKIMSDKSIDINLKKIMLESRKEYIASFRNNNSSSQLLDNYEENYKINNVCSMERKKIESAKKTNYFMEFINELEKKAILSNTFLNYKTFILVEIDKWITGLITIINLEFEMCWDIYNIIKELNISIEKKNLLCQIFQPIDLEEYDNYCKILEISELEFKLKEENKLKEIDELKKLRETNLYPLLFNLKKIGFFDNKIKILYDNLNIPIQNYLNLKEDSINLTLELFNNLNNFLSSIRINSEDKIKILEIFKN